MERVLKKCYKILDIPYSSTIEEVELRRGALIHLINTKAIKRGKVNEKRIKEINNAADKIIFNINKNGVVNSNNTMYDTNSTDAFNLIFTFAILVLFVSVCIYILL